MYRSAQLAGMIIRLLQSESVSDAKEAIKVAAQMIDRFAQINNEAIEKGIASLEKEAETNYLLPKDFISELALHVRGEEES
ncbi:hypothetical protein DEAC_c17410 [Desulfosporosinus acididurans]|uniref:Uncharacterized protein n=1 Tax=Desulfosporosinus acididurans TaxID=476652 RepID=A0A0J1FSQ8_9FIRM|nr:hypothetical protein [Desulfosporosinus acididurans]KLU66342.1 hypothetical protein DEAC_c17410 [Desulfosporosinus acididurans]